MSDSINTAILNWVPYKLLPQQANEELLCKWLYLGNKLMTAPFLIKPFPNVKACLKIQN